MTLYSKNGSFPKPETDGTEGWIEVTEAPTAGEGQEVVWWYPPGWVVRPVKPAVNEGNVWKWHQSIEQWVEFEIAKPVQDNNEEMVIIGSEPPAVDLYSASPT